MKINASFLQNTMRFDKFDACGSVLARLEKEEGFRINKAKFAEAMGLHRETMVNFAKGKSRNPGVYTLAAIADYFDCSIDDLVGRKTPSQKANPMRPLFLSQGLIFDTQLFFKVVDFVIEHTKKRKVTTFDQILNAFDSIYDYSAKQKSPDVDTKFGKWILDKLLV